MIPVDEFMENSQIGETTWPDDGCSSETMSLAQAIKASEKAEQTRNYNSEETEECSPSKDYFTPLPGDDK